MSEFFASYGGSLIAGVIVLAVVALIIAGIVKDRRAGKHLCGGDCANCHGCASGSSESRD